VNKTTNIHSKEFLPAFTGLRAIAAYGIFFYHINFFSKEKQPVLFAFVDQFYSFIPFFFVVSGFVIFYNYYKETKYSKKEFSNYMVSRVARIFPILIIINTVVFLLAYRDNLYSISETFKLYFLNITLLKGFSSEYLLTGIGPSWTNSVEEIFYLLARPCLF
jgi:peptidoglycan/LPS O-acetylase OafA/YrhL